MYTFVGIQGSQVDQLEVADEISPVKTKFGLSVYLSVDVGSFY